MATESEIGQLLAIAAASYPNYTKPDKEKFVVMVRAYHALLGHLPAEVVNAAMNDAMLRSPDFLPPAPSVLNAAGRVLGQSEQADETTALEQWGEVERHVRQFSPDFPINDPQYTRNYSAARFDNPVTQRIVDYMGGIRALHDSDNPVADRARFLEAYRIECRRTQERRVMLPGVAQLVAQLTAGNR